MAGAGDEMAAAGGYILAAHADRERVIDTLKAAFAEGRLTKDEFDARVARTSGSRTYAELAAVTADIPVWPGGTGLPVAPAPVQDRLPANLKSALWGLGLFAGIPPLMFAAAFLTHSQQVATMAVVLFLVDFLFAVMSGTVALGTVIDTRLRNRGAFRQDPRRPS
jgi:Domain of unknown function (DUF1707)